jgi:NDP-sugar pyrophosphorylase family protein
MVVDYLKAKSNFGMRVEVSREEELLDTGGGLKKAEWFFLETSGGCDKPFVLHNVDVISTIDLHRMMAFHRERSALATLAMQERETSRYLLFDEQGRLCGRRAGRRGEPEIVGGVRKELVTTALAFSGIHVISPRIFSLMTEEGAFSIITSYLRLAAQGEKIASFGADEYCWRDLGKPENIAQAQRDLNRQA